MNKSWIKKLWLLIFLGLSLVLAQVSYPAPSEKDLEAYFYGGMKVVDIDFPSSENVHFQIVDMRTMNLVGSGSLQVSEAVSPRAKAHFVLSLASMPFCQAAAEGTEGQHFALLTVKADSYYGRADQTLIPSGGAGSSQCLAFAPEFNWGHWTDLLAFFQDDLPLNYWLPVAAFIPNVNGENGVYDTSAKDWLVLLVFLGESSPFVDVQVSQEQIIQRIRDQGINPEP
jgi:hypothetical protein